MEERPVDMTPVAVINWDGVPDEFARPKLLPGDFFNARSDPRAHGAVFSTPGSGVAVSADHEGDETADYDVAVMDDFIYGEPQPVVG
jgi:hypothetical protein